MMSNVLAHGRIEACLLVPLDAPQFDAIWSAP
jgi:hypothetical protein